MQQNPKKSSICLRLSPRLNRCRWVLAEEVGMGQAQRFFSAFEPIQGHFHPHQHKLCATEYRETMSQQFESWRELSYLNAAA